MPTYTYRCINGHEHERMRIQPEDVQPRMCPECMKPAERQISLPQRPIVKGGTPGAGIGR